MGVSTNTYDAAELALARSIDEIIGKLRAGEAFGLEEYASEHPDCADDLRKLFPTLQVLADLGELGGYHRPANAELVNEPRGGSGSPALRGMLGEYRILRQIGRGGMGIVYEAEQVSLGRRVALKVLPFAAVLDPKHLQRFKNEAHAAASLKHPNIVGVYSVGCERAVHFYAMQYVEGQTLAAVIDALRRGAGAGGQGPGAGESGNRVTGRRGDKVTTPPTTDSPAHPITPSPSHASDTSPLGLLSTEGSTQSPEFFRTVARLGIQAAEALEHAHQMGVVHRDIKPSNLMVESRLPSPSGKAAQSFFPSPSGRGAGGEGAEGERRAAECPHLWITDFGLAMTQTEMNLTMTGDVLGTLRYMSPEQVQAKHGVLDHRTDVYSLGLTLYELLTLQPAFPGDNRQKLLRQVIEDDPRPPRQLNTSIPKDLETIILKATAKEPQSRYATAQQLADDLRRFVEDRPIRARPPSLLARAAKWARRHRAAVTATIAAAFLVVLAGAGFFFYGQQREAALRREAQQQRDRAEKNLQLALRAVDRIYLKYARDNYLKVGGIAARRITPEVEEFLNEAMGFYEQFAQANRDNPSVRVETVRSWDRVARVRSRLGMHDQAQVASQQAIDIAEELLSEFPDELQYRDLLCRVHYNRGAAFVEGDRFDQAVSAYTEAIEINPKFSRAFHNRGSARAEKGDLDKVIDDYTEAIRLSPASSWYAYHARGRMYLKKRQFAQAIEDFNNALKRGPQGDDVYAELGRGQLLSDLAWLLATCPEVRLRDPDRAVRLAAEAVKLRPYWRQTFGVARYRAGDFKGSIEVLEKSTKDPCSWSFLAMAYWQLGEKQEARQWYDQAVERLATLAKTLEARDTKMRLAPGEDLGPEPFRRFVTEAAQLLGLEPPAAPAPETTEGGPQAFVGHMIFAWSAWEDPIW